MKKLCVTLALIITACKPLIPQERYSQIEVGDSYQEVLDKLGVSTLDEAGAPDDFKVPGEDFLHREMTYIYFTEIGECEQSLRFQFKNYRNVEPNIHVHYKDMELIAFDFFESGC